jgi:O-acetyl-ADP-ribose deacetylase (regulator of RNase III)
MIRDVGRGQIELTLGDITAEEIDAIVNAANTKLLGGGGVDGALHRAAGPALKAECRKLPADEAGRLCPTGEVRVTGAGRLRARFVIHAVGPFYNVRYARRAEELLREVHLRALEAAQERGCRSIAFPAISTGAYRFPPARAAEIAIEAAASFLSRCTEPLRVRFVLVTRALGS